MYNEKPQPRQRLPIVPLDRRAFSFLIDFAAVWFTCSFITVSLIRWVIFILTWLALRVIAVEKNQGQSLGRWALDMKIIELRSRRIPDLMSLSKREGIVGGSALIAMIGLDMFFVNPFSTLILVCPLLVVCGFAVSDQEYQQALHDRVAGTVIVETRRGFSLDLRLQKIVAEIRYRVRK